MPSPIPNLKALKDGPLTLSLCDDATSSAQNVLVIYKSPSSADAATGVLYQVARASKDSEPAKFAVYQKWCGDPEGEDLYELANEEDPKGSYLVKKDWREEGVHKYRAVTLDQETSLWAMRINEPCSDEAVPEVKVYPSKTPVLCRRFLTLPPTSKSKVRELVSSDGEPTAVLTPSSSDLRKATWIIHVAPDMDARLVAGIACAFRQSLEYCDCKKQEQEHGEHTKKSLVKLQKKMRGEVGKPKAKSKSKKRYRGYGGGTSGYVPMTGSTSGGGGCARAGTGGGGCGGDKVAHVAAAEVAAEAADHVRTQARSFNLPPNLEDPIEEMLDLMLASFKEDREAGAERRPVRKTSHPGKTAEGHT